MAEIHTGAQSWRLDKRLPNQRDGSCRHCTQKPGYRQLYDVTLTPTLYLLDSEKRIIGKKLSWQQLDELLQVKWKASK